MIAMSTNHGPEFGEMRRVGDIMIPIDQYPRVRDNTSLRDAVEVLENAQLEVAVRKSLPRALLVYDEIGVYVGYVRRRDIMRGLEPQSLIAKPLEYRKKLFDVARQYIFIPDSWRWRSDSGTPWYRVCSDLSQHGADD